ncbi:MAG: LuxR family transcriptional regulator [Roseibium sp.]
MFDLGRAVEELQESETEDIAFSKFCSVVKLYGYENVCYTLLTDHPSINQKSMHGLTTSYPDDWMKSYVENRCLQIDPVVYQLSRSRTPFFWEDAVRSQREDPVVGEETTLVAEVFMNEAEDAGLADGIAVPFVSSAGEISGIGLSRTEAIKERDWHDVADLSLLSAVFQEKYLSFYTQKHQPSLTQREREVLCWASEGKTDQDISDLIGVSNAAIRFHWSNIFKKLDVSNRLMATTKAIRLNLVNLHRTPLSL